MTKHQLIAVLDGMSAQGDRWQIEAGSTDDDFLTMMTLLRNGERLGTSGMARPKRHPGSVRGWIPAKLK